MHLLSQALVSLTLVGEQVRTVLPGQQLPSRDKRAALLGRRLLLGMEHILPSLVLRITAYTYTSTDGLTWTRRVNTHANGSPMSAVTFHAPTNQFYSYYQVAASQNARSSVDGITWTDPNIVRPTAFPQNATFAASVGNQLVFLDGATGNGFYVTVTSAARAVGTSINTGATSRILDYAQTGACLFWIKSATGSGNRHVIVEFDDPPNVTERTAIELTDQGGAGGEPNPAIAVSPTILVGSARGRGVAIRDAAPKKMYVGGRLLFVPYALQASDLLLPAYNSRNFPEGFLLYATNGAWHNTPASGWKELRTPDPR